MMIFILSKSIAFSTVSNENTTIQFITLDSTITSIQDFSISIGAKSVKFTQTATKFVFEAEKSAITLKELSEYFQAQPTIKVTKLPEMTEIDVKVYIRKLLYQYSEEPVDVVINYESESQNYIQFTFPVGFQSKQGQFLSFGQDFFNQKTNTNVVRVTCRDFVQINPAPCYDKMKALIGQKSVSFITHGNQGFQFQKMFFLDDNVKITTQFAQIDDKIKFTVMQIVMMVLMVVIVLMAIVLPIMCCKMNGRKSVGNRAIQCGFGPQRINHEKKEYNEFVPLQKWQQEEEIEQMTQAIV